MNYIRYINNPYPNIKRGVGEGKESVGEEGVVLFCSLAVLDPRVGHTMDVLSPFIPVLCHSD